MSSDSYNGKPQKPMRPLPPELISSEVAYQYAKDLCLWETQIAEYRRRSAELNSQSNCGRTPDREVS